MPRQPQALDRNAEDLAPRNAALHILANAVLKVLGEDWSWDDDAQVGVHLVYRGGVFTCVLEDAGYTLVSGRWKPPPGGPEQFMPALGFHVPIEDGSEALAYELRALLRKYAIVTGAELNQMALDEEWEAATHALFKEFAEITGKLPDVTRGTDPSLNLDAFFKHGVGDSVRIHTAPGEGPYMSVYVPTMQDLRPFVQAWALLERPQPQQPVTEE